MNQEDSITREFTSRDNPLTRPEATLSPPSGERDGARAFILNSQKFVMYENVRQSDRTGNPRPGNLAGGRGRPHRRDDPPPGLREFGDKIGRADSFIIVSPEYDNGYPGVLKNALDYLLPEYERKPVGIVTVSAGGFGGINCLAQLRLVTIGMGAFPIPENLSVSRVHDSFQEDGTPNDAAYEKRAAAFLDEVLWFTEAIAIRKAKSRTGGGPA